MYWVVLSVILLAESWTVFIIGWYSIPWLLFTAKGDMLTDPKVSVL